MRTNSQILAAWQRGRRDLLTAIERQIGYVASRDVEQKPCPNCGTPHNVFEAAGVEVDDYDYNVSHPDRTGPCRACGRTLIYTLPMMGDWHWRLDPAEGRPQMAKAAPRAYPDDAGEGGWLDAPAVVALALISTVSAVFYFWALIFFSL